MRICGHRVRLELRTATAEWFRVSYWIKHYEEPSEEYGISGGRISKLMLKQDCRVVYNYDRGEDVEPLTPEAEKALAILLHEYN